MKSFHNKQLLISRWYWGNQYNSVERKRNFDCLLFHYDNYNITADRVYSEWLTQILNCLHDLTTIILPNSLVSYSIQYLLFTLVHSKMNTSSMENAGNRVSLFDHCLQLAWPSRPFHLISYAEVNYGYFSRWCLSPR